MVHFGARLAKERYPAWADQYLNYSKLKERLEDIKGVSPEAPPSVGEAKRHIFQGFFDDELKKVLQFYGIKLQELTSVIENLEFSVSLVEDAEESAILEVITQMQGATADLARLINYISLNLAAVRKCLKKYAKNAELSPVLPGFLALRIEHPTEKGHIITQGTFLPMSVANQLDDMAEHQDLTYLATKVKEMYARLRIKVEDATLDVEQGILVDGESSVREPSARPSLEEIPNRQSLFSRLASFYWTAKVDEPLDTPASAAPPGKLDAVAAMDKLLRTLDEAEAKARRNAHLVHAVSWAEAQAGILEPAPRDEDAVATPIGLWLNCINSGLYMANYNLVIPTLSALCNHIGVDPAMVGLVIGCCDVTTVLGTMGYSIWTNTSYKWPLLASGVACLLGNLTYSLSYDIPAFGLLLFARLLTGLGSARTVNRRYIAMYVARKNRTAASALFVSLSAVGMALGPLLALPLSHFPDLSFAGVTFNNITMGGWVMSLAWIVFLAVGAVAFEDPLKKSPLKKSQSHSALSPEQEPLLGGDALSHQDSSNMLVTAPSSATTLSSTPSDDEEELEEWADDILERVKRLWCSPFVATLCCIFLCFGLKLVQQAYIDGLSIFTEESYDWTGSQCGIMLGILGLAAPIVNQSVGKLSSRISDRAITVASIVMTGIGAALLTGGPYPKWNFFAAGVMVYMGTIVLEAVSMSLTSKVIDERLSKGLWNAGLLSTQAGTLGRLCGNLVLSLCAGLTGTHTPAQLNSLSRLLFGICSGSMLVSLAFVVATYKRLVG
eukprot:jgi/Botrbrau1/6355/Bobra.0098s0014.1